MSNFFSNSGADDHPSGGDNFFSFKNETEEQTGGSFFGNDSSSGDGDHGSFFKPSPASKTEGNFLDFGGTFSKPEAEPTFLAPFSRTPPRKRQNQGPPPTPVCQPSLQQSAAGAKIEGSNTQPQQLKGNSDPSLGSHVGMPSHSAASSLELAHSAPSSNSQNFGGASASPAQQNSNMQSIAVSDKGYNEVNSHSWSMSSTQQHGPGIGSGSQVHPMEDPQKSSKGFDEHRQQSKVMSSGLMSESKCGVEEAGLKEEKFEGTTTSSGRMGGSIGERNFAGQPLGLGRGQGGASSAQGGHPLGGGQGLLKQLLAKQTQRLAELLTPELEKAMSKEERMVKELEQVEQEGRAYRLQLEGMKERFGGRLGQISGFLGMNTKK